LPTYLNQTKKGRRKAISRTVYREKPLVKGTTFYLNFLTKWECTV
jgi:hypothetical protein